MLLKIDGVEIADDGTVKWRKYERVNLDFMIQSKFSGDETTIQFLRAGAVQSAKIVMKQLSPLILDTL